MTNKIMRIRSVIIAPVCLVLLIVTALSAQQQYQQTPPPPSNNNAPEEISEDELDKAARAFSKISEMAEELQASLQTAGDKEQAQKMQQNANQMMIEEVEKTGLSVERYNEILQYTRSNNEFWLQFQERVKNLEGNEESSGKE